MTKIKVLQIGVAIGLLGFASYKFSPVLGLSNINNNSISNLILISIVLVWVFSYLFRVLSGNMTFMEQRKRYRKEYEKIIAEKLQNKFDSLSTDEQDKLIKELDEK